MRFDRRLWKDPAGPREGPARFDLGGGESVPWNSRVPSWFGGHFLCCSTNAPPRFGRALSTQPSAPARAVHQVRRL
jgi:hypothetical protein